MNSITAEFDTNKPEIHMTFSQELLELLVSGKEVRIEGPGQIYVFNIDEKNEYDL